MVVTSEVDVIDFNPTEIAEKGCLQPDKILLIDTQEGKIYYNGEIKERLANAHPYRQWLSTNRIQLEKLHSGRKVEWCCSQWDSLSPNNPSLPLTYS